MTLDWLADPDGQAAIEALRGADPLRARQLHPELTAEQVTAALTQARHKPPGFPLRLVTSEGIQQATPIEVALRRARRLAGTATRVVDAGCGIGVDSWAFNQAGLEVLAFEQDPATAQIARHNGIDVVTADVTTVTLPHAPVYVDPARRRVHHDVQGRPVRVHDPQQWRPPWSWVRQHAAIARVAPGSRDLPPETEWHCTSIDRTLVDATLWWPPRALTDRRASVLHQGVWHELEGPATPSPAGPVLSYLLDPDPAIVRTGLVGSAASLAGGHLLDPDLAFITTGAPPPAWLGRAMQVLDEVPLKEVRQTCTALGIQRATVWARGFTHPPRTGLPQGTDGIVVAARLGPQRAARAFVGRPVAWATGPSAGLE
jgi:hypothetical protein